MQMGRELRKRQSGSRIAAYEQLLASEAEQTREGDEIYIPPGPRLGDVVVKAEGLRKAYGDKLLFENLSFEPPAAAASSASSVPTARARRRSSA